MPRDPDRRSLVGLHLRRPEPAIHPDRQGLGDRHLIADHPVHPVHPRRAAPDRDQAERQSAEPRQHDRLHLLRRRATPAPEGDHPGRDHRRRAHLHLHQQRRQERRHRKTDERRPQRSDLTHTLGYSYDPRDRITKVTKDTVTSELYTRDASDNVTAQTIGTTPTSFKYDRDRLLTATSGGATVSYNYDPFGRLDTVTDPAGTLETNTYDGFDNITSHQQRNAAGSMDTTRYTYDPLNRITSQAVNGATPTSYAHLGLTGDLTSETTTTGTVNKSYAYTPAGQRLYQYTPSQAGNTTSPGYYSYNDHNDTEAVTGSSGTTTATYGYTAYGQPDPGQFTGQDKNNTQPSASSAPFNSYRLTPCAGTLPPASTTCGSGTTPPP